jgi:hypothetical protein
MIFGLNFLIFIVSTDFKYTRHESLKVIFSFGLVKKYEINEHLKNLNKNTLEVRVLKPYLLNTLEIPTREQNLKTLKH